MQFEVIRKSHRKEITIGVIVFVLIAIVLIVHQSYAKYKTVKNMKIAEGTINYKVPDFNVVAMYKNDGSGYVTVTSMPASGYNINTTKSYCNLNNTKDTNVKLSTNEEGQHIMSGITKGNKCYLYFDKIIYVNGSQGILANVTVKTGTPNFGTVATTNEGVYKAKDESGKDSYYWRGAVTNNYVKFANKYWRIIRINGDGSIRLIYDGPNARANGSELKLNRSIFNTSFNNNMYVGFKYTSGQVHGIGTKSIILTELETWYTNNLASYASKLDTNAGFCGDRTPSTSNTTSNGSGGTGTTPTYYGGYIRLVNSTKSPVLTCPTEDFYTVSGASKGNKSLTYPIGLITADEVATAGGVNEIANRNYYLYNGSYYWTMTPYYGEGASMFIVTSSGSLSWTVVNSTYGVRPVINLRADVTLTGTGTASDPFVVQ